MEITFTHHKKTLRVVFENGEIDARPVPFSRVIPKPDYQPVSSIIEVVSNHGEAWQFKEACLFGYQHKKDGSVGQREVSERFYGSRRNEMPEVLRDAVDALLTELNNK